MSTESLESTTAHGHYSWRRLVITVFKRARSYATHGILALALSGYVWFYIDRARTVDQIEKSKSEVEKYKTELERVNTLHAAEVNSLKERHATEINSLKE